MATMPHPIVSTRTSQQSLPAPNGLVILPTLTPPKAGSTWRSLWICYLAKSWAGPCGSRWTQLSWKARCRWHYKDVNRRTLYFISRTRAASKPVRRTRAVWQAYTSKPVWAERATVTTTRSLRVFRHLQISVSTNRGEGCESFGIGSIIIESYAQLVLIHRASNETWFSYTPAMEISAIIRDKYREQRTIALYI